MLRDRKGVALILVLVVIVLMVGLVVEFSYNMKVDVTLAANQRDELKAYLIALSGAELAKLILMEDDPSYDALDEEWAHFQEMPGTISEGDEGLFRGMIFDEAALFPINALIGDDGKVDEARLRQLERLFDLLGIDPQLIDAILDWLDPDDAPRPFGAEDPYYQGLSSPYPCKDGPFITPEELILVEGMKRELLYGEEGRAGLINYLSTFSDGKINVNTAPPIILQTLSDGIDEVIADTIVSYREREPFLSPEDLQRVPGITHEVYEEIKDYITTKSSVFSIRVEGEVRDIRRAVLMVVRRDPIGFSTLFWRAE